MKQCFKVILQSNAEGTALVPAEKGRLGNLCSNAELQQDRLPEMMNDMIKGNMFYY